MSRTTTPAAGTIPARPAADTIGARTGAISTEEIKARIAAMFADDHPAPTPEPR